MAITRMLLRVVMLLVGPGLARALETCWVFGSGMVLQADQPVPVWGQAEPGVSVTVSFASQVKTATSGQDGEWMIRLDPMEVSAKGRELRIESASGTNVFQDVVVGDVWLCAGQSNMQKPWLGEVPALADEVALAAYPMIREFRADLNVWSEEAYYRNFRVESRKPGDYAWFSCDPVTAKTWPAVPYYFARMLQKETGRPIGLLRTQIGATGAESWVPWEALAAEPRFAEYMDNSRRWIDGAKENREEFNQTIEAWEQRQKEAEEKGELFETKRPTDHIPELWPRWWASVYYNANIAPLRDFALRGVIWYQGENNAAQKGGCAGDGEGYTKVMEILIREWRRQFKQPELPFYQVQLSAFGGRRFPNANEPGGWVIIREAQERVARTVPHSGMAVSLDIGEKGNIHPVNKQPVGERLARLVLRDVYGQKVIADGPRYASHVVEGHLVRVRFEHLHGGLKMEGDKLEGFSLAGANRLFVWAEARLDGEEVVVWSDAIKEPVAVRYGYAPYTRANLYNAADLPAVPFRTDEWPLN